MKRGRSQPAMRRRRQAVDLIDQVERLINADSAPRINPQALAGWREQYLGVRKAGRKLTDELLKLASREDIHEAARRLGILHRGTIVFENESETTVLMDTLLYHFQIGGRSVFEHFLSTDHSLPDLPKSIWLAAAMRARFTLLLITDTVRDFGLVVRDVFSGEELLVADINFSQSARPGLSLATRILPLKEYFTLSGAALPIWQEGVLNQIGEYLRRTGLQFKDVRDLPAERALWLESFILQTCLRANAAERVIHADPNEFG